MAVLYTGGYGYVLNAISDRRERRQGTDLV